ncbi:MAG: anaerobic ribonucleoside-triphosphate reductase [Candidatus Thorarchaeota archaeon]
MGSDKNTNFLEKQLKTLGQKVRIDILKKLSLAQDHFSFSKLQKEVLEHNLSSVNFSFHLNALKKCELIDSTVEGYYITKLGNQILDSILSIERILKDRSKTRMIRTSKYSKESFDSNKIEEYLVVEGELDVFLARHIAREVEERLAKTSIEYLTAPLMREYINVILLENGLEEVRHKLTRLGTPPFEVFKLFNSKEKNITPERFLRRLGSDVSEQFLLLNLLPKNLADLYLTGEIAFLHLNYWSLRPLSIYLNTDSVFKYILNNYPNISNNFEKTENLISIILVFCDFLKIVRQFYSEDLLLGDFYDHFLMNLNLPANKAYIVDILTSQMLDVNESFNDGQSHLSIGFNSTYSSSNDSILHDRLVTQFLYSLIKKLATNKRPLLLFRYSDFFPQNSTQKIIDNIFSHSLKNNIILKNNSCLDFLNSAVIKISNPKQNVIILDKILLNLHMISVEAKQNDDMFIELLQEKMKSIFELFNIKKDLVEKKLGRVSNWVNIIPHLFGVKVDNLLEDSIKSVSFFGLNKAVLNHCGIELDRTEGSTSFALRILTFMKNLIEEQNVIENNHFILSQPHPDKYLQDCWYNGTLNNDQKINCYSSKIIRENSSLTLDKKFSLFKKFENVINGGSIFGQSINANYISLTKYLKMLINSKINAFSLRNFENYSTK